jgi:PAS domain S-box-containing protein
MQRILIVDDNDENLYYLQALLCSQGYEVTTARNGAEALDAALADPPELVISDLLMPVMDGFTLLRKWKSDPRLNRIPFIVYTATYTDPKDEQLALDLGTDAFIVKPTEPAPFMAQIRDVLTKAGRGDMSPANAPVGEETGLLRQYSEVLIRKLEAKTLQLEEANRTLSVREAHLRAIIENSPNCITSIAFDGTVLTMNAAGLRMLEADSEEKIVGRCGYPEVVPEFRDAFRDLTERVCRGESGMIECEIEGLKGSRRWLEMYAAPLRDPAENRTVLLGIAQDITERKRSELAQRQREAFIRSILDSALAMIAVLDSTGVIIAVNQAWRDFADSNRGKGPVREDIGANYLDVCRTATGLSSEEAKQASEGIQAVINGSISRFQMEYSCDSPTGIRWFLMWAGPLNRPEGGVVVSHIDITERKKAEAAQRRSDAELRTFVENAPYAIYRSTIEHGGRFLAVNPALVKMLGYETEEEVLALNLEKDLYRDPEERHVLMPLIQSHGSYNNHELHWNTKSGKELIVRSSGRLVRAEDGTESFESIAEDVSERRLLEQQFRQAQKMEAIGRLAGGVAHDFNNILGVIMGFSELSRAELNAEHPVAEHLAEIETAAKRAISLTRQLLAFSRQQVVFPKVLNLNEVVNNVSKMLSMAIGEDIALSFKPSVPLGSIKCDLGQMEQILMNLAVNARDAMPNGGQIVIETRDVELDENYCLAHEDTVPGQYVMLSMSDTGCGMDEATRSRIFEPFFTTKELGVGTGLGLSTVYGIVKQSGGYIWVYSEPQRGTTFKIYFPRIPEITAPSADSMASQEKRGGTETILLVEDDYSLRNLTSGILMSAGYKVLEAQSPEKALQMIKDSSAPIHLLLTDVIMPNMNGVELWQQAKELKPGMKVMFISGYAGDILARQIILVPNLVLLEKPFSRGSLLTKVHEVLHETSESA